MENRKETLPHAEINPYLGNAVFNVEGAKVKVSWSEFNPERSRLPNPGHLVIFLPGWPWQAQARATWDLPRWLTNEFGLATYNIDTQTSTINPNILRLEAEGIRQFVLSRPTEEVTIFGHSEGTIRAVNLTHLLEQQNPEITINGVVLANPMGFYPQSFRELAKNFVFVEIAQIEPEQINPRIPHMPQIKVLMELLGSLWQDVKAGKLKYPWMFAQQMREMRRIEPILSQIKAPILVLTTDKDFVSNYRRYLPEEEIEKRTTQPVSDDAKYRSMERMVNVARAREQYTKEKILPQAGPVKVLLASRFGSHIGLPVERYQQVSHVVSRIFDRMRRTQENNTKIINNP